MFCPLAVDWGSGADWAQVVGTLVSVLVAVFVWRRQSIASRSQHEAEALLAREVQKQALQPHISISRSCELQKKETIFIGMKNNGLGPAVIKMIQITHAGVVYNVDSSDIALTIIRKMRVTGRGATVTAGTQLLTPGEWLPAGDSRKLIWWHVDEVGNQGYRTEELGFLLGPLSGVDVRVVYESVFGEQFESEDIGPILKEFAEWRGVSDEGNAERP